MSSSTTSPAGTKTITFDLATGNVSADVAVKTTNVKLDIVNGDEISTTRPR